MNDRETLEYLCWNFATTAQGFWPIERTARECVDANSESADVALAWERGQHSRAVMAADELFTTLYDRGYDPVELAAREQYRIECEQGVEMPPLKWDWLRFARLPGDYTKKYVGDVGPVEATRPDTDSTVDTDGTSFDWTTSIRLPESDAGVSDWKPLGEDNQKPTEVEITDQKDDSTEVYQLHSYTTEIGSGMVMARLVER